MSVLESSPLLVLSPHPDDAVLSCGGLLAKNPDALVLTLFAADPPLARSSELSSFVDQVTRRREDSEAIAALSCAHEFLDYCDAIDRVADGKRIYTRFASLFGALAAPDLPLVRELETVVDNYIGERLLVCPIGVGAHVDHQLCAHVGRRLQLAGRKVWFYQDAPYVFPDPGPLVQGDSVLRAAARMRARVRAVEDVEIDRAVKEAALAHYSSQIAMLFGDMSTYQRLASRYYESLGGVIERFHVLDW